MCTSLYLHRAMTHQGLWLHPFASWPMRWWLWLFTGMNTREWVSVHRKHHAFVETEDDPHSPVIHGWASILIFGVKYYRQAAMQAETIARFSKGCPNDVIERKVFMRYKFAGPVILLGIDLLIFGPLLGAGVWTGQVLWVPFWAAGFVNGLGHTIGYRNYTVKDASRNIVPLGFLLSGEELHNNHHKFPASAKFSKRWFEVDMGWWYIQALRMVGLAKVEIVQHAVPNFKKAALVAKETALEHVHEAAVVAKEAAEQAKTVVKVATKVKLGPEY